MELAGMGVPMVKQQLSLFGVPVPSYAIFRKDFLDAGMIEKAWVADTTETYEVMQDAYMFAWLDGVLESEGAHYESAGSINNGAQAWALVNLNDAFEIGASGDRHENYLCFTEDRTGSRAAKAFLTSVRVVCANTYEAAYRESERCGAAAVTFRHTKNLSEKMQDAYEAFTGARQNIHTLRDKLTRLSDKMVTKDVLENTLNRLFPAANEKAAESPQRIKKMLETVKLFESNDFNQFPEIRGTGYNLFNAVTEWVDHFSGIRRSKQRSDQTDDRIRAERAMFGEYTKVKQSALDIILEETAYAPNRATRKIINGTAVLELEREAQTVVTAGDDDDAILLDAILEGGE